MDYQKLDDLPVPTGWASLMDPIYENNVTISGWEDDIPDLLSFNFYQHFGDAGLVVMEKNDRNFWSSAEMVRTAENSHPEGTAICVLNLFFAQSNRYKGKVSLLWTEEDTWFSSPMILAKQKSRPQSQLAIDFK